MHEDEGNGVGIPGTQTGPHKWNAVAVWTFDGLHFYSFNFGGEDARASGQRYFQKGLRLVFDDKFYFRQGMPFRGYESCDYSALGHRGEHAAIREARPFEGEAGRFVGL